MSTLSIVSHGSVVTPAWCGDLLLPGSRPYVTIGAGSTTSEPFLLTIRLPRPALVTHLVFQSCLPSGDTTALDCSPPAYPLLWYRIDVFCGPSDSSCLPGTTSWLLPCVTEPSASRPQTGGAVFLATDVVVPLTAAVPLCSVVHVLLWSPAFLEDAAGGYRSGFALRSLQAVGLPCKVPTGLLALRTLPPPSSADGSAELRMKMLFSEIMRRVICISAAINPEASSPVSHVDVSAELTEYWVHLCSALPTASAPTVAVSADSQHSDTLAALGEPQHSDTLAALGEPCDENDASEPTAEKERPALVGSDGGPPVARPALVGSDGGPPVARPALVGSDGGPPVARPALVGSDGGPPVARPLERSCTAPVGPLSVAELLQAAQAGSITGCAAALSAMLRGVDPIVLEHQSSWVPRCHQLATTAAAASTQLVARAAAAAAAAKAAAAPPSGLGRIRTLFGKSKDAVPTDGQLSATTVHCGLCATECEPSRAVVCGVCAHIACASCIDSNYLRAAVLGWSTGCRMCRDCASLFGTPPRALSSPSTARATKSSPDTPTSIPSDVASFSKGAGMDDAMFKKVVDSLQPSSEHCSICKDLVDSISHSPRVCMELFRILQQLLCRSSSSPPSAGYHDVSVPLEQLERHLVHPKDCVMQFDATEVIAILKRMRLPLAFLPFLQFSHSAAPPLLAADVSKRSRTTGSVGTSDGISIDSAAALSCAWTPARLASDWSPSEHLVFLSTLGGVTGLRCGSAAPNSLYRLQRRLQAFTATPLDITLSLSKDDLALVPEIGKFAVSHFASLLPNSAESSLHASISPLSAFHAASQHISALGALSTRASHVVSVLNEIHAALAASVVVATQLSGTSPSSHPSLFLYDYATSAAVQHFHSISNKNTERSDYLDRPDSAPSRQSMRVCSTGLGAAWCSRPSTPLEQQHESCLRVIPASTTCPGNWYHSQVTHYPMERLVHVSCCDGMFPSDSIDTSVLARTSAAMLCGSNESMPFCLAEEFVHPVVGSAAFQAALLWPSGLPSRAAVSSAVASNKRKSAEVSGAGFPPGTLVSELSFMFAASGNRCRTHRCLSCSHPPRVAISAVGVLLVAETAPSRPGTELIGLAQLSLHNAHNQGATGAGDQLFDLRPCSSYRVPQPEISDILPQWIEQVLLKPPEPVVIEHDAQLAIAVHGAAAQMVYFYARSVPCVRCGDRATLSPCISIPADASNVSEPLASLTPPLHSPLVTPLDALPASPSQSAQSQSDLPFGNKNTIALDVIPMVASFTSGSFSEVPACISSLFNSSIEEIVAPSDSKARVLSSCVSAWSVPADSGAVGNQYPPFKYLSPTLAAVAKPRSRSSSFLTASMDGDPLSARSGNPTNAQNPMAQLPVWIRTPWGQHVAILDVDLRSAPQSLPGIASESLDSPSSRLRFDDLGKPGASLGTGQTPERSLGLSAGRRQSMLRMSVPSGQLKQRVDPFPQKALESNQCIAVTITNVGPTNRIRVCIVVKGLGVDPADTATTQSKKGCGGYCCAWRERLTTSRLVDVTLQDFRVAPMYSAVLPLCSPCGHPLPPVVSVRLVCFSATPRELAGIAIASKLCGLLSKTPFQTRCTVALCELPSRPPQRSTEDGSLISPTAHLVPFVTPDALRRAVAPLAQQALRSDCPSSLLISMTLCRAV